jgi:hypothetical protein
MNNCVMSKQQNSFSTTKFFASRENNDRHTFAPTKKEQKYIWKS